MIHAAVALTALLMSVPVVTEPLECRLDQRCPLEGRCTALGGECVVGSAEDCLSSNSCQHDGACIHDPAKRACTYPIDATVPVDCRETPACREGGQCTFSADTYGRGCTASEESCEASLVCKMFGRCFVAGTSCGGDRMDGCERGRACKLAGACSSLDIDNTCHPTPASCARAPTCKRAGRCTTDEFSAHATPGACRANEKGCAASEACKLFGRCTFADGRCVVAACKDAEVCAQHGACTLVDGQCRVAAAPPACELVEVTGLTATANSAQKAWKTYTFGADNLVDRDLGTSWQPEKKKGVGARIDIALPAERTVAAVHIANGFQRRDGLGDLQAQNGAYGHVKIEVGPATTEVVELLWDREPTHGYYRWDVVALPATPTRSLAITALSVSPGLVFDDLAVSEVRVFACRDAAPTAP